MDKVEKRLQKVIYAFIMSVIIIVAAFAVTIYYYETKSGRDGVVEGLFAKAFVDESVGSAPLEVNFSSLAFNFEGTPAYHWDFGDGNTSNETSPIHNYTEEGEYTCNLTITDNTGENVTTSIKILVVANNPPTVTALVSPSASPRPDSPFWLIKLNGIPFIGDQLLVALAESDSPLTEKEGWVNCEAGVSDPEGDEIVFYEWELQQPPVYSMSGRQDWPKFYFTGENRTNITFPLIHTFRRGPYDVKVTVTDAAGNKASSMVRFDVSISNREGTINLIKQIWKSKWGPNFQYQKDFVKDVLHPLVWKMLGPIHNLTDNMVKKILAPLPPDLRDSIYSLYYTIAWDKTDKTYHRPNWNPPNIPSGPSPTDNATRVGLGANLSWNCSDPDGDGIRYDIYFGQTLPPSLVALDQTGTTYSFIAPMESNTTYYWNIVAKDKPTTGGSKTTYGPLWSFTTQ